MTTLAPQNLRDAAAEFERLYASAVFSGIVGDMAHRLEGGYHISLEDQSSGNYSCVRLDDAAPPGDWPRNLAAAIDMSMNSSDMATASRRVEAVWANPADTRRKYFNCINGWLGSGDAVRWDFVTGKKSYASPDHKWHTHSEIRRRYVNDPMARKALVSMYAGESHDQWLASIGQAPPPPPAERQLKRELSYNGVPAQMMYGDDVVEVQRKLKINYRSYGGWLAIDGWYGNDTKGVVTEFQRRAGLSVDGIVGPQTRARLGIDPYQ